MKKFFLYLAIVGVVVAACLAGATMHYIPRAFIDFLVIVAISIISLAAIRVLWKYSKE